MPSDLSNSPSSELPTTVGGLEPPCTPAIDAPMTTPRVHSPSPKATWGKQEGSISEQSKSKYPETTRPSQAGSLSADGNLQLWYHRMISLNVGISASHTNEQSYRWTGAILKKKYAMQTMLEAQMIIEEIEVDVSIVLGRETIEHM
ncbi:hypothetical protein PAXINDRAFT_157474 [Paxillus involutus ATCC 200175]|uniref:Uncharacterized protein n=1 Tax=Paxillus involutus ATCC 200175 TaxID=664439 RepID=A0A0C9TSU8_PAXIN|nr:hypothetical protein PAXINDRAFT_157474 [Paxillus involutus ATCC 200175]